MRFSRDEHIIYEQSGNQATINKGLKIVMEKKIKKSRKAVQLYTFNSSAGEVKIDLNNYVATCSVTGAPKRFYHVYLANLINTKYDGNISTFEDTYVSRAARSAEIPTKKANELQARIDRMYAQIKTLKQKKAELIEQSL